ncbi:MAG: class I SAM-dependent methyltransferase [Anaerolineales bacterium]|nr:class I SAM-dependent methyltransferase [Anaerolineales bacterium]
MVDFDLRARDWDCDPQKRARAKAVAAAIRTRIPLGRQMAALEYGCGTGLLSFALQADLGSITLADSSAGMLAVLAEKVALHAVANMRPLQLDLSVDPLPELRFDLVYSLMTLHHILDPAAILGKFYSLLRRPGFLCIADLDREDGSFHADPGFAGHNGFDRKGLRRLLRRSGFARIHFDNCFEMMKNGRVYSLFLAVAEKAG